VHDVAWPHPCNGPLDVVPPSELPLDEPLDPELPVPPELPELLAAPPLEPELLDVGPELLPLRVPLPLPVMLPPLLPMPPLPPPLLPPGWPLFMIGVTPLEVPLVPTGGGVVVPPGLGVEDVQPEIETAMSAAIGDSRLRPAKSQSEVQSPPPTTQQSPALYSV
jgi:hypothetical protein